MVLFMSTRVNILLSTYNGAKYLQPQLDSLYQQTYINCSIFVRDDGSSDDTLDILKEAQSKGSLHILPSNENLGPANSFFALLKESPADCGFFAFCDQDDIWMQDKIHNAVTALKQFSDDTPVMYFSRVTYVDANNKYIKLSPLPKCVGLGNALVENVAIGCTVVINKPARDLITQKIPKTCLMHDSWCYLLMSCLGNVIYDPMLSINYRQHASNTIGASTSILQTIIRRFKRFKIGKHGVFRYSNQSELLLELYGNLIGENKKELIVQFVNAKQSFHKRLILALSPKIWRQNFIDNLILRALIIFNRY